MKIYLIKIIVLIVIACTADFLHAQTDTLTIDRCLSTALKNNPQLKIAESVVSLNSANLTSSRSVLFPQLNFNSGWTRNGGNFFAGPTARSSTYENYSTGFQLQQLVYDFGKSYSKISASTNLQESSYQEMLSAKQSLILNVYIAYYNLLSAMKIKNVSSESLTQAEEHLKQAELFYEVGKKPKFDVLKAATDKANAKVNLISAENNISIARLQLENLLNSKLGENVILKESIETGIDEITLPDAVKSALAHRPDYISQKLKTEANKSLMNSAWSANLPNINLVGGYNWRTFSLSSKLLDSWNLGLSLSLPIFQGFAIDASVDVANANLKGSEAQLEAIELSITLETQQQLSNLKLLKAKLEATKALVEQATETLNISEGRYTSEVGSQIEVTDSRLTLLNASIQNIQAMYDYQITIVRIKKALGVL